MQQTTVSCMPEEMGHLMPDDCVDTTVLCRRMPSIGPPSFRESNRTARRHGGFMKPLDQLWKRLVALYKKLVYGVARVGRWDA